MGPYNSYLLFGWGGQIGKPAEPKLAVNLGLLYTGNYLRTPGIFYCPSLRQTKSYRVDFEKKYFESAKVPWPMYAVDGQVNMTYMYFPQSDVPSKTESEANFQLGFVNALGNVKAFLLSICAAVTFTVLLGTVFPLVVEALRGAQMSVGRPYFDKLSVPIGVALLFVMGEGDLCHEDSDAARHRDPRRDDDRDTGACPDGRL